MSDLATEILREVDTMQRVKDLLELHSPSERVRIISWLTQYVDEWNKSPEAKRHEINRQLTELRYREDQLREALLKLEPPVPEEK